MIIRVQTHRAVQAFCACVALCAVATVLRGQELSDGNPLRGQDRTATTIDLPETESRLAERYDRLELLAGRLAELSRTTQPRRARLLRELIAQSRDRDISGRFESIIHVLQKESYSLAQDHQAELHTELQKLLELLLREDRDRQIESQRKKIRKYLSDLNRLIRQQRGVRARTEGGDNVEQLAKDQEHIARGTDKLGRNIEANEGPIKPAGKQNGQSKNAEPKNGQPKKGPSGKPSNQPGQPGGKPSSDDPSPSAEQKSPDTPSASPMQRAQARIQQALKKMQAAQKKLEEAQRHGATDRQEQALRELEQAKAELERILRQLREEELEQLLVLLEARFRKMLEMQTEVYEKTKRLDQSQVSSQEHEVEIASGRLSRKERQIVREADRALILLREDGSSVAFPEAIEQAREDMQEVASRLSDIKLAALAQGLEEDIITALEESLAALQQALKKLRKNKGQPGRGGKPGEQSLVDQLAELRMIRALQQRVNRRTQRYNEMIAGRQAHESEMLQALDKLALRQERIYEATHDLHTKKNQ